MIKPSEYHDSVSLMLVASELSGLEGVLDAAVVMATEANKAILAGAGLLTPEIRSANANDLVISVKAGDAGRAAQALEKAEELLKKKAAPETGGSFKPKTLRSALSLQPDANLAVISVAGRYAADEAWEALLHGLHVLLFSDNVSLEDEIALKEYACDQGLLLMGPGAGTAILNGVALGFANVLPHGPVGIVSAAGTGLQEVSSLLARRGVGLSQGIGTGGRDLKQEVGGRMFLQALRALQADPATQVLVLISKPPAEDIARRILQQAAACEKPTVVCFLGGDLKSMPLVANVIPARTLQECSLLAVQALRPETGDIQPQLEEEKIRLARQAREIKGRLAASQRYLRGLYSGGTLCYEAQVIWKDLLHEPVSSNAPLPGGLTMPDSTRSSGHCAVDLGEEEFTVGRPHPMIDNSLRIRRLLQEARDPQTAVILLDVVLGYGAHPDPAGELAPAIRQARELARTGARELAVVASVTGTQGDPQGLGRTIATLEASGAFVCDCNAAAAYLAGSIVSG
ncbi:acyl-CoA synthetase FdrA [Longilinea arvoryzae]|nr:acyl-CoA synthetase FdrA [Longilinea arvoryzae]